MAVGGYVVAQNIGFDVFKHQIGSDPAQERREHPGNGDFADFFPAHHVQTGQAAVVKAQNQRRAHDAADDGMCGGYRQAFLRGKQQPQRGGGQRGHHDVDKLHRLQRHAAQIHNAVADGVGYAAAGQHRAAHFKHRRHGQRLRDAQRAGTHRSAEGVGHVVAADVERHKDAEQCGEHEQRGMVVLDIAQPPIDEIAGHAEQHGHTDEIDAFQTQLGRRTGHGEGFANKMLNRAAVHIVG